ncbi:unnamed protein product [Rhizophagus irregularis]|nr:unnamed protein product [Rhizophagus irregularis]
MGQVQLRKKWIRLMSEFVVPYRRYVSRERNLRPSYVSDESAVGSRGKDSGNGKDDSLSIHGKSHIVYLEREYQELLCQDKVILEKDKRNPKLRNFELRFARRCHK